MTELDIRYVKHINIIWAKMFYSKISEGKAYHRFYVGKLKKQKQKQ